MSKPLTRAEIASLASTVAEVLARIEAGELTAGASAVSFLAGARAALDAVGGAAAFQIPVAGLGEELQGPTSK